MLLQNSFQYRKTLKRMSLLWLTLQKLRRRNGQKVSTVQIRIDTEVPDGLLASDTDAPTVDFTEEEQWAVSAPGDLAESLVPPPADFVLLNEELATGRQDCLSLEQIGAAGAGVEQVSEFGHLRNAPIDAKKTDPYSRGPNAREEFFALNVRKLDRRLSAKQQEEWENIYASFRAHSALHGIISGK